MAHYMYYMLFFRDKWKISRFFMFNGLYTEPFLAVQNFWKGQWIIYLQNTYHILVLTVWRPTRQDTKMLKDKVNLVSLQKWLKVKLALYIAEQEKVASPLCLYWLMDNGSSLCWWLQQWKGQPTAVWFTPLGCWTMARYWFSGRECDCKSTSQGAHVPKSWGTEEHWKNEQMTKLLQLKRLTWSWTGNIRVGYFHSLMG